MEEGRIYMNNAATSWPKPDCVAEAVGRAISGLPGSANRSGVDRRDVFLETRRALAKGLGVPQPEDIALGCNATWGLNLAIQGFPFGERAVVLTTCAEHNSVIRPLHKLEKAGRIRAVYLDTDAWGRVPVGEWEKAVSRYRPELCIFSHASNVTGAVNDARRLTGIAKAAGAAVLIDASQTLGWTEIHAGQWGADMVAFTGHKYLLGPQGTGGLYVRRGLTLNPLLAGGTGIHSDMDEMPEAMPLRLEAGTGNEPSFSGLLAALCWAEENPLDRAVCEARLNRLKNGLAEAGARVIAPEGECTPVVSFTVPGYTADEVGYILTESYDMICRSGLHCAPRIFRGLGCPATVRLSLSRFTADWEIDAAVSAVGDIAGG
ncbi:MAG TPA: cysteine desulfurase [Clostridiales bacterium]|nr:cysteine desulfurase [Clostridiales bacterium]